MIKREESRHDLAFMAGVIIGAISGALAALALTPMSGAETREKLRETTGNLAPVKEKVASATSQAVATGKEKAAELAAKSPLPVGQKQPEQDVVVREDIATPPLDLDTGFGSGEHTMAPAEGSEAAVDSELGKPPAGSRPQTPSDDGDV